MPDSEANPVRTQQAPERVTGVQIMQGIGVRPPVGFWADVWQHVTRRRGAVFGMCWVGVVAFLAVFSPLLANGHPLVLQPQSGNARYPLWEFLTPVDLVLLVWALIGLPFVLAGPAVGRGRRFWITIGALAIGIVILGASGILKARLDAAALEASRDAAAVAEAKGMAVDRSVPHFVKWKGAGYLIAGLTGLVVLGLMIALPFDGRRVRAVVAGLMALVCAGAVGLRWNPPLEQFPYVEREIDRKVQATYTLIPWSPLQRYSALDRRPPGTIFGEATSVPPDAGPFARSFILGTDAFGSDVLSQLMHSCRLSISIGLVSTTIALLIGVTMGALMGYFGGWVDLFLYRIVEVFMAVPVLFLLIVAVAVLPDELRNTYIIMAIIGCFTWTGMARFTRAEFMKLRHLDFVQAAQATGVPLRSLLFRHMLPNGIAPVLVDMSFAVAAAISYEATLSYLGLGPVDSASWGKLLASAVSSEGGFKWWLAVFPGAAIFLTVLSYNLIGEALRDAIDPKLKKARV